MALKSENVHNCHQKNNGSNCTGSEIEIDIQSCTGIRCPENCNWSSWSDWSNCSGPCGNQFQMRNRTQYGPFFGGTCTGNSTEEIPCSTCLINLENIALYGSTDININGNTYVSSLIRLPSNLSLTVRGDLTVQESGGILLSSSNLTVEGNLNLLGHVSLNNSNIVVRGCVNISGDITVEKDPSILDDQVVIISKGKCINGRFQNVIVDGLPPCMETGTQYTDTTFTIVFLKSDNCMNLDMIAIIGISIAVLAVILFLIFVIYVRPVKRIIFPFAKNPVKNELERCEE